VSGNYAGRTAAGIGNYSFNSQIATLNITNSTISGNSTQPDAFGAGVFNYGVATVTDSTVEGNTASSGGGLYNSVYAEFGWGPGMLTLTNTTVSGNTATQYGGGISNSGVLTLTNSTVSGNTAAYYDYYTYLLTGWGGGVYNFGTATITNSTVSGNTAYEYGGGISTYNGTLNLTNSTVSGNTARGGGGIFITGIVGTLTLTNSTVSGNTAWRGGGIMGGRYGDLTLTNSTVSGNTAGFEGGGIFGWELMVTPTNTIVADNSAPTGANCESPPVNSLGYNLTDDTSCGFTATGDLVVPDAMLGPLQDNGGPTETHDLLDGSPAIDAGSVSCPPPDTDQRGVARPQGTGCDIGAVEFVPEPQGGLMLVGGIGLLGMLYRRRVRRLRFG
jgi:predicted outer membrane repeat protein